METWGVTPFIPKCSHNIIMLKLLSSYFLKSELVPCVCVYLSSAPSSYWVLFIFFNHLFFYWSHRHRSRAVGSDSSPDRQSCWWNCDSSLQQEGKQTFRQRYRNVCELPDATVTRCDAGLTWVSLKCCFCAESLVKWRWSGRMWCRGEPAKRGKENGSVF